ncbi:MAG: hypothetical protein H6707_14840 [Deltaproteobacteria bacterium]|nr:hypothetical protein [Deltaproteobacteria bacterium]
MKRYFTMWAVVLSQLALLACAEDAHDAAPISGADIGVDGSRSVDAAIADAATVEASVVELGPTFDGALDRGVGDSGVGDGGGRDIAGPLPDAVSRDAVTLPVTVDVKLFFSCGADLTRKPFVVAPQPSGPQLLIRTAAPVHSLGITLGQPSRGIYWVQNLKTRNNGTVVTLTFNGETWLNESTQTRPDPISGQIVAKTWQPQRGLAELQLNGVVVQAQTTGKKCTINGDIATR